jgi:pimeloyl-ACP methyl ester carboxylesterase
MTGRIIRLASLTVLVSAFLRGAADPGTAAFSTRFVAVDTGVSLEVVDWGGNGRPIVLLAGLGATAHVFDSFAKRLTPKYHVFGITRRGFAPSSVPAAGYAADRLGDDVLAVIDRLKVDRPVLIGHSLAGEELSSIGSRHPEKISGLVYLEAAYTYAFYDPSSGDLLIDSIELRNKIDRLVKREFSDESSMIAELLAAVPRFEKDLLDEQKGLPAARPPETATAPPAETAVILPAQAILAGIQKYTRVGAPVLAIFAYPHAFAGMYENDPAGRAKAEAQDITRIDSQAKAVEQGAPAAHIVRIAHAKHMIFTSNESDVVREVEGFVSGLPRA